jgi:hypothetical protein
MSAVLVVVIVLVALVSAFAGVMIAGGKETRERTADLAAEFWDWLKLGR